MKYCKKCGGPLPDDAAYCQYCGASTALFAEAEKPTPPPPPSLADSGETWVVCPHCGGRHIDFQIFQENRGSSTREKSRSTYREEKKHHGILWRLFVSWWWWIIKLILWVVAFLPMALLWIGRRRNYQGESTRSSETKNKIGYQNVCVCKDCGYSWYS